ncbi:MAG TPA: hemolysin family protein [Candidatus Limnocylindrales bacterium]|nr:hemolysin family protein [Candidatus Limnocylindrales bacterium]
MDGPFLELLVIVLLVFLNAIFVAAEIALVTIRRTRVDQLVEEGRRGARRVRELTAQPGRFLAVIQLGITFIGFLAAAFAGASLARGLEGFFDTIPAVEPYAAALGLLIVTALLSFFTIVFGELVPKTLALATPERYALLLAGPVEVMGRLLRPIVWALERVTGLVNRVLGVGDIDQNQISTEELKLLVERGGEQGILEAEEEQMIHAVIELGDRRVHEVMVPRIAMAAVPASASLDEAIGTIVEHGHSRIPVYEESVDEIVGILYAKDLLPFFRESAGSRPELRSLLRPPVYIPESMTVDDLLHEFQRRKVHIAIVLDEYGGTAGLVTIEDLLEEIVGEIQDEYDAEEPMVVQLSDDEARVDGRASVDDLVDLFDTDLGLEDEDEYDTVGGLIYHRIGGVPAPGDQVVVDGLTLTVESTDGRRVGKVLVVRQRTAEGVAAEQDGDR